MNSEGRFKVGELGLISKHISNSICPNPTFGDLCTIYIKEGLPFRKKDGRRKTKGTIETYTYHLNNHILPRWKNELAVQMKPIAIRNWLFELHDSDDYAWETCSKIAGTMSLVFSFVDHNEVFSIRNPMDKVTIPASEEEHEEIEVLLPEQVASLLECLSYPMKIAVLLVAVTGVRISECLGLTWKHVEWAQNRILDSADVQARGDAKPNKDDRKQGTRGYVRGTGEISNRMATAYALQQG